LLLTAQTDRLIGLAQQIGLYIQRTAGNGCPFSIFDDIRRAFILNLVLTRDKNVCSRYSKMVRFFFVSTLEKAPATRKLKGSTA